MVKFGDENIHSLRIGNSEIEEAFIGSDLVYRAKKPSRLPEGYTEVEYIESGSGQYINTGLRPNGSGSKIYTKVVLDVHPETEEGNFCYYFGTYRHYTGTVSGVVKQYYAVCGMWVQKEGKNLAIARSQQGSSPSGVQVKSERVTERITITWDGPNDTASVGEASAELYDGSIVFDKLPNIALLARYTGDTSGNVSAKYPMPAKLFSAKIFESDVLVRDFVPCYDASGVAGLYDLVNDLFYKSASDSDFLPGPAV